MANPSSFLSPAERQALELMARWTPSMIGVEAGAELRTVARAILALEEKVGRLERNDAAATEHVRRRMSDDAIAELRALGHDIEPRDYFAVAPQGEASQGSPNDVRASSGDVSAEAKSPASGPVGTPSDGAHYVHTSRFQTWVRNRVGVSIVGGVPTYVGFTVDGEDFYLDTEACDLEGLRQRLHESLAKLEAPEPSGTLTVWPPVPQPVQQEGDERELDRVARQLRCISDLSEDTLFGGRRAIKIDTTEGIPTVAFRGAQAIERLRSALSEADAAAEFWKGAHAKEIEEGDRALSEAEERAAKAEQSRDDFMQLAARKRDDERDARAELSKKAGELAEAQERIRSPASRQEQAEAWESTYRLCCDLGMGLNESTGEGQVHAFIRSRCSAPSEPVAVPQVAETDAEKERLANLEEMVAAGAGDQIRAEAARVRSVIAARIAEPRVGAFHWRDGWTFARRVDGTVGVECARLGVALTIPSLEWASIVAAVVSGGDSAERELLDDVEAARQQAVHEGHVDKSILESLEAARALRDPQEAPKSDSAKSENAFARLEGLREPVVAWCIEEAENREAFADDAEAEGDKEGFPAIHREFARNMRVCAALLRTRSPAALSEDDAADLIDRLEFGPNAPKSEGPDDVAILPRRALIRALAGVAAPESQPVQREPVAPICAVEREELNRLLGGVVGSRMMSVFANGNGFQAALNSEPHMVLLYAGSPPAPEIPAPADVERRIAKWLERFRVEYAGCEIVPEWHARRLISECGLSPSADGAVEGERWPVVITGSGCQSVPEKGHVTLFAELVSFPLDGVFFERFKAGSHATLLLPVSAPEVES